MQQFILVGEIGVEERCCCQAEQPERHCSQARQKAEADAKPAPNCSAMVAIKRQADTERDHDFRDAFEMGRQHQAFMHEGSESSRRPISRVRSAVQSRGDLCRCHDWLPCRREGRARERARLVYLVTLVSMAFCRSARSSQPAGQSFVNDANCSLAFAMSPVST